MMPFWLAVSCAENVLENTMAQQKDEPVAMLKATLEQSTKTTVVDGGPIVFWEQNEQIKVSNGTSSAVFTSTNTELATTVEFVPGDVDFKIDSEIWAVYPAEAALEFQSESVTVFIPSEQTARAGSFDKGMNISIARSTSSELQFFNVCGGVRFKVEKEGLRKIQIGGVNGETLAGKATVSFVNGEPCVQSVADGTRLITVKAPGREAFVPGEWYYVNALPAALPNGLDIYFYGDGIYGKRELTQSLNVKRSVFGSLSKADSGVDFEDTILHSDISKPEESGLEFVEFINDSTLVVKAHDGVVPKQGQLLTSGPTDQFPYGLCVEAESVEMQSKAEASIATKGEVPEWVVFVIHVANPGTALVDALLSTVNVDIHEDKPFELVEASDMDGNNVEVQKKSGGYTVLNNTFNLYKDKDTGSKISLTPNITIYPDYLKYDIVIEDGNINCLNFDIKFDTELYAKLDIKINMAHNKNDDMIPLWSYIFAPIPAGPLVFTPLFTVYAQVKADASVTLTYVPFYVTGTLQGGFKYDGEDIHPYENEGYFKGNNWRCFQPNETFDKELKLKGEEKIDIGLSLSVGLYGCNYIGRIGDKYKAKEGFFSKITKYSKDFLALEAKCYLEERLSAQFEYSEIADHLFVHDIANCTSNDIYHYNDKVDAGLFFGTMGQFDVLGHGFDIWDLKDGKGVPILSFKKYSRSLLLADYDDVSMDIKNEQLVFSATKFPPLLGYKVIPERYCGFCYNEVGHNSLKFISCEPHLDPVLNNRWAERIEGGIPLSSLVPGSTYTVYPYSYLGEAAYQYFLYNFRKGKTFKYTLDGNISNTNLPDIPGEDL